MRAALSVSLLLVACTASPVALEWKITSADADLIGRVVAFETEIRRDACGGPIVYRDVFTESGMTPPVLSRGRYAFVVVARDASCDVVARGWGGLHGGPLHCWLGLRQRAGPRAM